MPDVFGVEITGVEQALMRLKMLDEGVRKDIESAIVKGGLVIANEARNILDTIKWEVHSQTGYVRGGVRYPKGTPMIGHYNTGNLRRSLNAVAIVEGDEIAGYVGSWLPGSKGFTGTDAPYAPYVEALPDGGFLFPAYRMHKDEVQKWIADAILVRITQIRSEV